MFFEGEESPHFLWYELKILGICVNLNHWLSILGMHAHFKRIHIICNVNTVHRIYGYMANPCIQERERERERAKQQETCFLWLLSQVGSGIPNHVAEQFQPVKIARFERISCLKKGGSGFWFGGTAARGIEDVWSTICHLLLDRSSPIHWL